MGQPPGHGDVGTRRKLAHPRVVGARGGDPGDTPDSGYAYDAAYAFDSAFAFDSAYAFETGQ